MRVVPSRTAAVDLTLIPALVRTSGYSVARMRIVARGAVEGDGGFRIDGWSEAFPVAGRATEGPAFVDARAEVRDGRVRLSDLRRLDARPGASRPARP